MLEGIHWASGIDFTCDGVQTGDRGAGRRLKTGRIGHASLQAAEAVVLGICSAHTHGSVGPQLPMVDGDGERARDSLAKRRGRGGVPPGHEEHGGAVGLQSQRKTGGVT